MAKNQSAAPFVYILLVIAIGIAGYYMLTAPDEHNGVQKLGDAIHELPEGADNAARELKSRTPLQRMGDGIDDSKS